MEDWNIESHKPLREIVYSDLKMKILRGDIEPGTRLMEMKLSEEMGVSRTPIREAIRQLEKEGLVTIEPRRGAYASEVSQHDLTEILEVREDIEGLAAQFAAERMDDETMERLNDAADRYAEAVKENNTEDMIKYDTDFHHIIVEGSGNKVLVGIVEQIQEFVLRFRYIYYEDFRRVKQMPREHSAIIDAVASGDPERARSEAEVHVERLKKVMAKEKSVRGKTGRGSGKKK